MNSEIVSLIRGLHNSGVKLKRLVEITQLPKRQIQQIYLNERWKGVAPYLEATEEELLDAIRRFNEPD